MSEGLSTLARLLAPSVCALALAVAPAMADDDDDSRTRKVNCDKGGSIQRKLDRAKEGDTIEVSGTCVEDLVIAKDRITLDCLSPANASITGAGGSRNSIEIRGRNVLVANCTVSGGANPLGAIVVRSNGSAEIERNRIFAGSAAGATGVAVSQNSYGQLVDNEISGGVNGVFVLSGSMADLFRNTISDVAIGIGVFNSAAADIVDNTLTGRGTGTGIGVFASRASTANFSNDVIFGNGDNVIQNFGTGILCNFWSVVRFGPAPPVVPQDDGTGNGLNANTATGCFVLGSAF
jgi:nitrous oxidase accessory protein NosD